MYLRKRLNQIEQKLSKNTKQSVIFIDNFKDYFTYCYGGFSDKKVVYSEQFKELFREVSE